jgi:hypothetical protein
LVFLIVISFLIILRKGIVRAATIEEIEAEKSAIETDVVRIISFFFPVLFIRETTVLTKVDVSDSYYKLDTLPEGVLFMKGGF